MAAIRDQLQTLTGANLTASQISDAGGKAFVSANASKTQIDLTEVVAFWKSIHVPTYGMLIPGTGKTATGSSVAILSPSSNETVYVNGLSLHNASAGDVATAKVYLQNALIFAGDIPPSDALVVVGASQTSGRPFHFTNGQDLTVVFSGAGAGDASWIITYGLSVQG